MKSWLFAIAAVVAVASAHAQVAYETWESAQDLDSQTETLRAATLFTWLDREGPVGPNASFTCKPNSTLVTVREWGPPLARTGAQEEGNRNWKPMSGAQRVSSCLGFCKSLIRSMYETAEEEITLPKRSYWKSEHPWGPAVQAAIRRRMAHPGQFGDIPESDRPNIRDRMQQLFDGWRQACGLS
jgi:hypothetical protein